MTTTDRGIPFHVSVRPPEASLERSSFILCDQIRTISEGRLHDRIGELTPATLTQVEQRLRILLRLG
jgi:mRNA interferase MazF